MKILGIIIFLLAFLLPVHAYDLAIVGVYRDTDCRISVKVKNESEHRIPSSILSYITIKLYGKVTCEQKKPWLYENYIKLGNFFEMPKYLSTIATDLYIDTEGNCKTNFKAEFYYKDKPLNDDNLANNLFSKNITGPCDY
jgi:hypothetical protein